MYNCSAYTYYIQVNDSAKPFVCCQYDKQISLTKLFIQSDEHSNEFIVREFSHFHGYWFSYM